MRLDPFIKGLVWLFLFGIVVAGWMFYLCVTQ
jgi:hypothetical protein